MFLPFAEGGAKRLRALLQLLDGNFAGADKVGTVHDMRFVFFDNDTKLLFATAYDGDWDPYIDDFATKIPECHGSRGCAIARAGRGCAARQAKDWLAKHQITAEGWYVANPDLTVAETRRLKRVGEARRRIPGQGRIAAAASLRVRASPGHEETLMSSVTAIDRVADLSAQRRRSTCTTSRRLCCGRGPRRTSARTCCCASTMRKRAASSCAG